MNRYSRNRSHDRPRGAVIRRLISAAVWERVQLGLFVGMGFSAVAVLGYVISGGRSTEKYYFGIVPILTTYILGGGLAGFISGVTESWGTSRPMRFARGVLAGSPIILSIRIGVNGFEPLSSEDIGLAVLGVTIAGGLAIVDWDRT